MQAVKNAVKEYETLLNELKGKDASLVTSDDISKLDEYEKKIKDTIATIICIPYSWHDMLNDMNLSHISCKSV